MEACEILVKALHENGELSADGHKACVREAGDRAQKARIKEEIASLEEMKKRDGRKVAK